jgi:FKBP-type peptidyl-prolyl cis-trans isomerase
MKPLLVLLAGSLFLLVGCGEKPQPLVRADPSTLKTTSSGLQYAILRPGTGPEAKPKRTVSVQYTGWLEDGTIFDSSVGRGEPFTFILGNSEVIQGWDEGVAGMKVGEKRQLVIPANLGYGDQGSPPKIPPGATLIFDVELVDANP